MINFFLKNILNLINKLNQKNVVRFGKIFGILLYYIGPKRRKITFNNIKEGLKLSSSETTKITKESYQNLGITLFEMIKLKTYTDSQISQLVKFSNIELIDELLSRGRGLIMMTGHYGNWELLAYSSGLFSKKQVNVIVKNQKNELFDKYIIQNREKSGNKMIAAGNAAREIINIIKNKGIVALIADQSADPNKDVFVDFFGRQAATYEAPASLALKFNIPIMMGYAVRQNDNTYISHLTEIDHSDLVYNKKDIEELTQRHVKHLENQILEVPGQWSWQHRRWKH